MRVAEPLLCPTSPDFYVSVEATDVAVSQSHAYRSNLVTVLYRATKVRLVLCLVAIMLGSHVAKPANKEANDVKRVFGYMIGMKK